MSTSTNTNKKPEEEIQGENSYGTTGHSQGVNNVVSRLYGGGGEAVPNTGGAYTENVSSNSPAGATKEPMSYEEYIEQMKTGYRQQVDAANKEAEIAKQKAMVDAQSSYQTNKAGYGANAEALAKMGLSGGGYSDYIEAQAYAQKRQEAQKASAVEAQTKAANEQTYQDFIRQANEKLAEKALYDERVADEREYAEQQKEDERLYNEQILAEQREYQEKQLQDQREYNEKLTAEERAYQEKLAAEERERQQAKLESDRAYSEKLAAEERAYQEKLIEEQRAYEEEQRAKQKAEDKEYQEYLEHKQAEAEKKTQYEKLLNGANSGQYTSEQLSSLGKQYGLDDAQIKTLTDSASKYKQNMQNETFTKLLGSLDMDGFDTLKNEYNKGNITQDQYNTLVSKNQELYYKNYYNTVEADFGAIDTADVDSAFKKGHITQTQYDAIKAKYNAEIADAITTATLFYASGSKIDETAANQIVAELKKTGWLSEENKSKIDSHLSGQYVKTDSSDDDGGCFAKGSMVTIADGSQVPIETLKEGDEILAFNHVTGKLDAAKILFIYYEGEKEYKILNLHFDGAENTEVITAHGFFDIDLNKYVLIKFDNVEEYIGHKMLCVSLEDGKTVEKMAVLTGYETYTNTNESFAVITTKHINCIVNNLLTVPDNNDRENPKLLGFGSNLFEYNSDHTYNKEEMESEIAKFGLVTDDEWCAIAGENKDLAPLFFGIGGEYLKIALGKGKMTMEDLAGYIQIGANHNGNTQ